MRRYLIAEELCLARDAKSNRTISRPIAKLHDPINITSSMRKFAYAKLSNDFNDELMVCGKNVSKAQFDRESGVIEITRLKGKFFRYMGYTRGGHNFLYPEECLHLMESSLLQLFDSEFPVSIEQAYNMFSDYHKHLKYQVYTRLIKCGYVVRPVTGAIKANYEDINRLVLHSDTFSTNSDEFRIRKFKDRFGSEALIELSEPVSIMSEEPLSTDCLFYPHYSIHNFSKFSKHDQDSSLMYYVFIRNSLDSLSAQFLEIVNLKVPVILAMFDEGDISFTRIDSGTKDFPTVTYSVAK